MLQDNLARLKAAHDAAGRALEIVEVEQPRPQFDADGRRLALSYVNFYMPNGGIVMPAFEDGAADKRAFDVMARPSSARDRADPGDRARYGGGGIHSTCLPQPTGDVRPIAL